MNRLLFGLRSHELMEEVGDGGPGDGTPPASTPPDTTEATPPATPPADGDEPKPYIGEPKPGEEQTPKPGDEPKEYGEEDYVKGVVKDEALLGNDSRVQLDEGYVKAMVPAFKEVGITPEQASKLANAFAKAQIDDARERLTARREHFESMKQESLRRYNERDWGQINAAIDANFKPGGVMNFVIRNSELGADPEFLALLHRLGASVGTDTPAGAVAGSGSGVGDANSFAGLSSMW